MKHDFVLDHRRLYLRQVEADTAEHQFGAQLLYVVKKCSIDIITIGGTPWVI